ncbi:D-alanine--D-alanine ligase [Candidatus Sumerlaeota bacterium]
MYEPKNDPPLIWLLCGGPSPEYKVSLASALNVALALDRRQYAVLPICIRPSGEWWFAREVLSDASSEEAVRELFEAMGRNKAAAGIEVLASREIGEALRRQRPDCAIIMIHGELGEDGVLQGMLEVLELPYTGSGVLASALGMDKILCQSVLRQHGILTPPFLAAKVAAAGDDTIAPLVKRAADEIGFPCFVKPASGGSSIGISLVESIQNLTAAIRLAADYDPNIMIERKINGAEVTCGVLDQVADDIVTTVTFPPTEIIPLAGDYFDYECKYTPGKTNEITPARFDGPTLDAIRATAQLVHATLGCEGYSRVDMIQQDKETYVIEVNTVPGMTETSLLPQGARAHGLSVAELFDQLIRHAWWRH